MGDMDQLANELEAIKKNPGPVAKKSSMKAAPSAKRVQRL